MKTCGATSALAALTLLAGEAQAADLCQQVTASHSLQFLLDEKSGGIVQMIKPASFPADVKSFVIKSDDSFQDQEFQTFPLGKDGAGLAVHYEGSEAEQYTVMFDRVNGHLAKVDLPNLNPTAQSYRNLWPVTIGGAPALFSSGDEGGKTITRIAPWQGHAWDAICEIASHDNSQTAK